MPARTPLVGGNWKMNADLASARGLAGEIVVGVSSGALAENCEIVLFPPFPYITSVGDVIRGAGIQLGAQDVYHEANGAFTGEVSVAMLRDVDCSHVIVGHSERRHVIGEDDRLINAKLQAALHAGLNVLFCIGEKLEEREGGKTEEITLGQLEAGLKGVDEPAMERVVIAYEPVWAIGTGKTASPEDAQEVHETLRRALESRYNAEIAESTRILYGGSVKAKNARALAEQPDVDGFLVGGASLDAEEFLEVVRAAARL